MQEQADNFATCLQNKKVKVFKFKLDGFIRFELRAETQSIQHVEQKWNEFLYKTEYKLKTQQNGQ